jgi:hypothetical protein
MLRVLLSSALPVLGIGLAAASLSPNLLAGPGGDPLILTAPAGTSLQAANFDGEVCASSLLFAGPLSGDGPMAGTRILAFALRSGENDVAVAIEDYSAPGQPAKTVVLVFDDIGNLLAAGDPESLHLRPETTAGDCIDPARDKVPRAPI